MTDTIEVRALRCVVAGIGLTLSAGECAFLPNGDEQDSLRYLLAIGAVELVNPNDVERLKAPPPLPPDPYRAPPLDEATRNELYTKAMRDREPRVIGFTAKW